MASAIRKRSARILHIQSSAGIRKRAQDGKRRPSTLERAKQQMIRFTRSEADPAAAMIKSSDTATGSRSPREDNTESSPPTGTSLLDLPQELREMVYAHFPGVAVIHINQDPSAVLQPAISRTCRLIREEALNVFYSRKRFFLDLRGWKSSVYPRSWTPRRIFNEWVKAIGNSNATRIKHLSFFSHNFTANIQISTQKPPTLLLKFRTLSHSKEVAEGLPAAYNFSVAARRAEKGLRLLLDKIEPQLVRNGGMNVADMKKICRAIELIQPFLCTRPSLGWRATTIPKDDMRMEEWPCARSHLRNCGECGYLQMKSL